MEDRIRRHALMNAIEHDGKAEMNSVLGKLIGENPEIKKDIKSVIPKIRKIVDEINSMTSIDQEYLADKLKLKKKTEKVVEGTRELPDLPKAVKKKVITAFPPEPGKYPHIGHAKGALINFGYAKKYKGKFILRFEESNPEIAKKEYYSAVMDGLRWLGIKWSKIDYLSDHLPKYYKAIEQLIKSGNAYVCLCSQDNIKKSRAEGVPCEHRKTNAKTGVKLWKGMLKDTKEGTAVVRMKIDIKSLNTAMRDPTIARIITASHPRTKKKYRVWPNYDLGTAMLDSWEGVTHRVRTKEFELRKELQDHILKKLKLKSPFIMETGRTKIKDAITQGREIRGGIDRKVFSGWDDPRLATLTALRRRGFHPDGIKEFLMSTGMTKAEGVYDWQVVEAFNRKVIDPLSDRYFGVLNPVKIKIEGLPKIGGIEVATRPGSKKNRKIPVENDTVYIDKEDEDGLKDQKVGLMFLCTANFGPVKRFVSRDIQQEVPKIHWVGEPNVKIKVVMPDGTIKEGLGETGVRKLKVNQTVQLYRVGFCRVDKVGKEIVFYFTHK